MPGFFESCNGVESVRIAERLAISDLLGRALNLDIRDDPVVDELMNLQSKFWGGLQGQIGGAEIALAKNTKVSRSSAFDSPAS